MDEFAAAAETLAELIAHNDREATLSNILFCNCVKLLIWLNIKFMRGGVRDELREVCVRVSFCFWLYILLYTYNYDEMIG